MGNTRMEGRLSAIEEGMTNYQTDMAAMREMMLKMQTGLSQLQDVVVVKLTMEKRKLQAESSSSSSSTEDREGGMRAHRLLGIMAEAGTPEEEKLAAAAVHLDGAALDFFQWLEARAPICTWAEFKSTMLRRFRLSMAGNQYEELMSIKQTGTVGEYCGHFERLSHRYWRRLTSS
ncbi:hypothetical protein L484_004863 [Morus notabilis]|uniref:Retrotransposon gag domain-containing protein n=1 Tax=Morus notabilis TaxID=981085 RepID=W9QQC6_9ROSA|nr:hypothetical protein L484_004863 [Morus notabilis]